MNPALYSSYASASGIPQESKLATYMRAQTSTPLHGIAQSLSDMSLEQPATSASTSTAARKNLKCEYIPGKYFHPGTVSITDNNEASLPDSSKPTSYNSQISLNTIHQENVNGTTYFYSTSDSMNSSGILGNGSGSSALGHSGVPSSPLTSYTVPQIAPFVASPHKTDTHSASPHAGSVHAAASQSSQTLAAINGPLIGHSNTDSNHETYFYLPEGIRSELYYKNHQYIGNFNSPNAYPEMPEYVEKYTDLIPLEPMMAHTSLATTYRATHIDNGHLFALRRLHSYNAVNCKRNLDAWKKLDHPNIVKLHEVFTTKAFGDSSLIFVYEFQPGTITLLAKYLTNPMGGLNGPGNETNVGQKNYIDPYFNDPELPRPYSHQKNSMLRAVACGMLLPEGLLWSMFVQLVAALKGIHNAGLACRQLDATKVISSGPRLFISWCGTAESLMNASSDSGSPADTALAQQDDLTALGALIVMLACRSVHAPTLDNMDASMDLVSCSYSSDLKNVILFMEAELNLPQYHRYLIQPSPSKKSVDDLMPLIGHRFFQHIEALERRNDELELQLASELDNGRLFKLLVKLGMINERPELNMDFTWSETGDRYMLKLFRDHMFHAVSEDGRPWLDLGHLTYCLNELDSGTQNKVQLMSRDEESILVVSFAELKHCLEQAFDQIMQAAETTYSDFNL